MLVRVQGEVVSHFLALEELLDDAVGQVVELQLERGGLPLTVHLPVTDLHRVTPSSMLELAGGSVHALSYQQARNNRAVVGQVYVAEPGYMLGRALVPKFAIITSLDGVPTADLDAFALVLRSLQHGARVPLEYLTFSERHRKKSAILQVDRQWYGVPLHWQRDDAAGVWHSSVDFPTLPPGIHHPAATRKLLQNTCLEVGSNGVLDKTGGAQPAEPAVRGTPAEACSKHPSVTHDEHPIVIASRSQLQAQRTAVAAAAERRGNEATPADDAAAVSCLNNVNNTSGFREEVEEALKSCLVLVDVDIPLVALSDGVHARSFAGNGLVVHHGLDLGLVLVRGAGPGGGGGEGYCSRQLGRWQPVSAHQTSLLILAWFNCVAVVVAVAVAVAVCCRTYPSV
jgi:hypothetical protein